MNTGNRGVLDWLVVGGGIHGTHLSNILVNERGVDRDRVAVLDPHQQPLAVWRQCAANTGMQFLRSPAVHHIDIEPMSLLEFARSSKFTQSGHFRRPYDRPSLELFDAHSRWVCRERKLGELRKTGRAQRLWRNDAGHLVVVTDRGPLVSRNVLVATGSSHSPCWPAWAEKLRCGGADVWHVFDSDLELEDVAHDSRIGICGLGISAAQLAGRIAEKTDADVDMIARHDIRIERFDSDPCWLGPRCQVGFRRLDSYRERREAIREARHGGTMPRDVARDFRRHRGDESLRVHIGDVESVGTTAQGGIELNVGEVAGPIAVDALVLATGFDPPRVLDSWLNTAIDELELDVADCGFPIVDEYLCWAPGLFVSGPLAELELGPAARNIAGARMTARALKGVSMSARAA